MFPTQSEMAVFLENRVWQMLARATRVIASYIPTRTWMMLPFNYTPGRGKIVPRK